MIEGGGRSQSQAISLYTFTRKGSALSGSYRLMVEGELPEEVEVSVPGPGGSREQRAEVVFPTPQDVYLGFDYLNSMGP